MAAIANQIRTVAKRRISKRIGRLSPAELDGVDRAVAIQLGLRIRRWGHRPWDRRAPMAGRGRKRSLQLGIHPVDNFPTTLK